MKRLIRGAAAVLFALCLALPATARAGSDDGFEPVDGSMQVSGETIPASRLVGLAYGFILGSLIVYVASVVSRTRRLEEELEELKQRLGKR